MSCRDVQRELDAVLHRRPAFRVRQHLASCPHCRQLLLELKRFDEACACEPAPKPPLGLRPRLHRALNGSV
ncbi:MAG: hypothetical protein IH851_03725 [Armatimonadetes bacterium]|nr:hypothetical protein [Armatimonadota bacterium]